MLPPQGHTFKYTSETELARTALAHMGANHVHVNPGDTNKFTVAFNSGLVKNFENVDEFAEFLVANKVISRTTQKFSKGAPTTGRIIWDTLYKL